MKTVVVCKAPPERLPPVLSLVTALASSGVKVTLLVSRCQRETASRLARQGITVVQFLENRPTPTNAFRKVGYWRAFRNRAWKVLDETSYDFLWVASGDTALALGQKLLKCRYVLQLLELYDKQPVYRWQLGRYVRGAVAVVVPEVCRAAIFRVWFGLPYTPVVLPNKPFGLECRRNMPVEDQRARRELDRIAGRKLLLYQARRVRMPTFDIAEAVSKHLGRQYVLGILGQIRDTKMFARLKADYPDVAHFGHLIAPAHLTVTSHAHIGLLIYNYESLNNVFCAPNKVWEYAALRLPMMCHELPMLSEQMARYRAGETFKLGDVPSIARAVREIDEDYETYCEGAERLSKSVDLKRILSEVLQTVCETR